MASKTAETRKTAAATYTERYSEAQQLLERLTAALKSHSDKQANNPKHWGYPGDLGHVTEQLAYVLASLGDRTAVDAKGLSY